jgi:hypothetical protein
MTETFHFAAVFWGGEYREYFLRYCLASLLSPRNIASLEPGGDHRFYFCTTPEDWRALQADPMVGLLRRYATPELIDISGYRHAPGDPRDPSMARMSYGHLLATDRAFKTKAAAVVVCPDVIFSDGSVETLRRAVRQGKKGVAALGMRMRTETLLPALERDGVAVHGRPLVVSGRELVRYCIENYHSESKAFHYDSPHFASIPVSCIWTIPGQGAVIHTFSWAALLMNFAVMRTHETECLEKWTMDGNYISQNITDVNELYVVTDSDDLFMASFTKESVFSYPAHSKIWHESPVFREPYKIGLMRQLKESNVMDPLKRQLFESPVILRTGEMTADLARTRKDAKRIVDKTYRSPGWRELAVREIEHNVSSAQALALGATGLADGRASGRLPVRAFRILGKALLKLEDLAIWWSVYFPPRATEIRASHLALDEERRRSKDVRAAEIRASHLALAEERRRSKDVRAAEIRAPRLALAGERRRSKEARAAEVRASRLALAEERRRSKEARAAEVRASRLALAEERRRSKEARAAEVRTSRRALAEERRRSKEARAAEIRASRLALAEERAKSYRARIIEARASRIARIEGIVGGYIRDDRRNVPLWRKTLGAMGVIGIRASVAPFRSLKPLSRRLGIHEGLVRMVNKASERVAGGG